MTTDVPTGRGLFVNTAHVAGWEIELGCVLVARTEMKHYFAYRMIPDGPSAHRLIHSSAMAAAARPRGRISCVGGRCDGWLPPVWHMFGRV